MNQIEEMQNFVRIVEAGSITKAADQMNTVKSAVSRKLHNLETRLNTSLLSRTTRSQTLTDTGRQYYHHCLRILNDIYDVEGQISNQQAKLSGRIKMTVPLSFGLNVLSPLFNQFMQLHPHIELDIDLNDRKADLIEDGFDLAIRISKLDDSNLIARKIADVQLALCASPAYLKQYGVPKHPDDLLHGHQRLRYRTEAESWQFEDKNGESYHIRVPYLITANNGDFLAQAAVDGLGLTFIPDFIAQPYLNKGQLQSLLSDYLHTSHLHAYAVYPYTRHLSHRVRVLIEFLQEKLMPIG